MRLLIPLGLLGLIGIAVLLLIYIIKPNYQQKHISSTFIWKLSIKYKKKRLPVSKLRNILLIICQVLVIVACAMILAKPAQVLQERLDMQEAVIIIDSSASMRAATDGESRYIRAVDEAAICAEDVFSRGGVVSVIVADNSPEFLEISGQTGNFAAVKLTADKRNALAGAFDELKFDETACTYGSVDMDQTMELCSDIVNTNPTARVYFYTDADYAYLPDGVSVINVSDSAEWNAAIVNARAEVQDNHYTFYVDVASYGRDADLGVKLQIMGANTEAMDESVNIIVCEGSVFCTGDKVKTLVFSDRDPNDLTDYERDSENIIFVNMETPITSFQSVYAIVDAQDSLSVDNGYYIYNGMKEVLKVQYVSMMSNPFVNSALDSVREGYADRWDMRISEIRDGNYELEGFDFYIFEHTLPDKLPVDGAVLVINPDKSTEGLDINITGELNYPNSGLYMTANEEHPVTQFVKADDITVSSIKYISAYDASYKVLMSCDNHPTLLVKDEADSKIVVMAFSLHYSNIAITPYLSILFNNMFECFLPATVEGSSFTVNEAIKLNCRGSALSASYNGEVIKVFESFPAEIKPEYIGTYTFSQQTFGGKRVTEDIYVSIPTYECNIWRLEDSVKNPFTAEDDTDYYNDLLLYFAIALVSLLAIEWLLQMRETA